MRVIWRVLRYKNSGLRKNHESLLRSVDKFDNKRRPPYFPLERKAAVRDGFAGFGAV